MANYATMGWIGFVTVGTATIRATSCDLKTSQAITYLDVVDGRVDNTIYQIGPRITQGGISFPLIHDTAVGSCNQNISSANLINNNSLISYLWTWVTARTANHGRLNPLDVGVRYADSLGYLYPSCYCNSLTLTMTQSEDVKVALDVWGGALANGATTDRTTFIEPIPSYLSPSRVVTWNDVGVEIFNLAGNYILGNEMREFTVMVNNDLERFFTLNGSLTAFDIGAKKREVSGTLRLIGDNTNLAAYTNSNATRYSSAGTFIGFGFSIGSTNASLYWATALYGAIFEIEEVAISTGLFETTTKYRALADCSVNQGTDVNGSALFSALAAGGAGGVPLSSNPSDSSYGGGTINMPVYS